MSRKKKFKITVISFLILIAVIPLITWTVNIKNEKADEREKYLHYHYVVDAYQLNYFYDGAQDIDQIVFSPTTDTEEILNRWRNLADFSSLIDYPEEAIEQNDWLAVEEDFLDNFEHFKDVSIDMYDEAKGISSNRAIDEFFIKNYILYGSIADDNFMNVLIDLGFEESDG
ncbi:hypothetical protein HXA35_01845 [Bacillus sp. A301a_S52]|nr:hypothetical protein [Bacillus sp. A301a_S52]